VIRVALIFGGVSSEHEVSIASATDVLAHLDRSRFSPVLIGIDRAGGWHRLHQIDDLALAPRGSRLPDLDGVDLAFPVLHGRFGEDGTVQGLLELAGIPYVGCGVLASALAMDKAATGRTLAAAGIPVIQTISVSAATRDTAARRAAHLGFPLFVKPNRAGSSVGAAKVSDSYQLEAAIDAALDHDDVALIQPLMAGDEVDVGLLQLPDGRLVAGAPLRVHPKSGGDFFDYEAKYSDGGVEFELPARLDDDVRENLIDLAQRAFAALACDGLARVDFFVGADGSVDINEVNTMPGMTAHSQFPRMFAARGVTFTEVLSALIDRAIGVAAASGVSARADAALAATT